MRKGRKDSSSGPGYPVGVLPLPFNKSRAGAGYLVPVPQLPPPVEGDANSTDLQASLGGLNESLINEAP